MFKGSECMKNIWKLHRLLIASVAILCFALTGCGDKIEYGVMQPLTETDSRAVELITIYENYSAGRDYRYTDYSADHTNRLATTYYKIKPYIYGLMNTNSGDNYQQAAMNYIRFGRYQEALNALSNASQRDARWYYLSALAHDGLGNQVTALEHIRRAVSMEPDNQEYLRALEEIENGGAGYRRQAGSFRGFQMHADPCSSLCFCYLAQLFCCRGFFCC